MGQFVSSLTETYIYVSVLQCRHNKELRLPKERGIAPNPPWVTGRLQARGTAVAVKKLVVGSRRVEGGTLLSVTALLPVVFARGFRVLLIECPGMLAGLL